MMKCGYKFVPLQELEAHAHLSELSSSKNFYVKNFSTIEGIFKVVLIFSSDPYTNLPLAYIVEKPPHLEDRLLPHINDGWYLCYVQEMEADWNPNNILALYSSVDTQIQLTLDNSVCSINNGQIDKVELEGEFAAYWKPENYVYSLSNFEELHKKDSFLTTNQSIDNEKIIESVLFHNNTMRDYQTWVKQRKLCQIDSLKIHTFKIKVKPNRLSGVNWPPKNSAALFEWLSSVDPSAKAHLVNYFTQIRRKNYLVLLEIDKQDTLGIVLELSDQATQLQTYANSKKNSKKRGRKIQHSQISAILSGRLAFKQFKRISFINTDQQSIISRNRPRPEVGNLSSKNIALIGCGTIGGYVSELLLRSGAGIDKGMLDLFDGDSYNPQNFGRHPLSSSDFGKSKSIALKEKLVSSTHLKTNIKGYNFPFPLNEKTIAMYDIIIDATGRPPISKRLAYLLHKLKKPQKPIIIHGFNDGHGRASKVFIDYSTGCINCLSSNPGFYKNNVDLRFLALDTLTEKKISCGSTYTPYDAAVSVVTAALIQEAVLSTLETKQKWNYKEHIFDGSRSKKPLWISSTSFCDICNDTF